MARRGALILSDSESADSRAPELKMENTKDEELRIMPDPSAGGGYDPYSQPIKPPRSGRK